VFFEFDILEGREKAEKVPSARIREILKEAFGGKHPPVRY
jgi:hypothetical protein